jgi:hypothetical protein
VRNPTTSKPKLQGWLKSTEDAEALRRYFAMAKAAGRTSARGVGGWVAEWVATAAAAAAQGRFRAPIADDAEYRAALEQVTSVHAITDHEELKRRLVVLTARSLRAGIDPFQESGLSRVSSG